MTGLGEESSQEQYQQIKASELYPKKPLKSDDSNNQVPFPELCGESTEFLGKTTDGVLALSNYRLFVRFKDSFVNVPLGLIESVEYRDIFFIYVCCKDAHSFRCTFSTNEVCLEWYKRLCMAITPPNKVCDVFAFPFNAYLRDQIGEVKEPCHPLCRVVIEAQEPRVEDMANILEQLPASQLPQPQQPLYGGRQTWYSFDREVERMGLIDKKNQVWKITHINEQFKVCASYPKLHIVPKAVSDTEIETVAGFRASRRFPSVVWRDRKSGAVIARCSQPEVGWLGWRNNQDEALIDAISSACLESSALVPCPETVTNRKTLIVDARSYTAALANRAKGGGCECIEYYPNCEIQFMSLANIHTVRKSFQAIRTLCSIVGEQSGWLQGIETTKWLHHMSSLLKAAVTVVQAIDKEWRPVLVHCSDGWDRTPQIVALAEILLDSYYRTFEGFRVLVEREWLEFGHKFADRCGLGQCSEDTNERCPVFLQFLDCVHQLQQQYPLVFQFNEAYLVKLAHHTYSNLYGTFLCNNVRDRLTNKVPEQTSSVWTLVSSRAKQFINPLYIPLDQVLEPSWHLKDLQLWRKVYMHKISPSAALEESATIKDGKLVESLPASDNCDKEHLPKTRSCENLVAIGAGEHSLTSSGRRLSDPNIKMTSSSLVGGLPIEAVTTTTTEDEKEDKEEKEEGLLVEAEGRSSIKGIVINNDCVTFCQRSGSSDTLVSESSAPMNSHDKAISSNTTLETSINDIEEDIENRVDEENEMNKERATTIPSQDTLEDCDKSAQCSTTTDPESRESAHHLINGGNHGSELVTINGCHHVLEEGEAEENVVVRQPGSAVFSCRHGDDDDSSQHILRHVDRGTSINGSISDTATLMMMKSHNNTAQQQQPVDMTTTKTASCGVPSQGPKSPMSEEESRDSFPSHLPPGQSNKKGLLQVKASNMSTSTSDISDSHVHIDFKSKLVNGKPSAVKVDETLLGLDMSTVTLDKKRAAAQKHLHVDLGVCRGGNDRATDGGYSKELSNGSLPSDGSRDSRHTSAAASSTGTPSPASEKSCWSCSKPQNGVNRYLDVDGLHIFEDPVQDRMMQIITSYQEHVCLLEGKLQTAKSLLYHYTSGKNGAGRPPLDESLSGDEDTEHCSLGGRSATSDASYELVGEDDALMTLWVPDHAVTHCTGCDVEFWIVRRRHHCRNCGKVFCGSCAPHYTPVPQQQLTDPVRVCRHCYMRINNNPVESSSPDKEAELGSAMEEEDEEEEACSFATAQALKP